MGKATGGSRKDLPSKATEEIKIKAIIVTNLSKYWFWRVRFTEYSDQKQLITLAIKRPTAMYVPYNKDLYISLFETF